jgi:hypothetical protein
MAGVSEHEDDFDMTEAELDSIMEAAEPAIAGPLSRAALLPTAYVFYLTTTATCASTSSVRRPVPFTEPATSSPEVRSLIDA